MVAKGTIVVPNIFGDNSKNVRCGVRTHDPMRGSELKSDALDHSANLTVFYSGATVAGTVSIVSGRVTRPVLPNHICILPIRFRGVVVITSALHAEGPQFDPGRNHLFWPRPRYTAVQRKKQTNKQIRDLTNEVLLFS